MQELGAGLRVGDGGGLLAGVSLAVKTLKPQVKVIAVEAENVASFSAAMEAGQPTRIAMHPTLADGLVCTNTSATEQGGISGRPLFGPSTAVIREVRASSSPDHPLIG